MFVCLSFNSSQGLSVACVCVSLYAYVKYIYTHTCVCTCSYMSTTITARPGSAKAVSCLSLSIRGFVGFHGLMCGYVCMYACMRVYIYYIMYR